MNGAGSLVYGMAALGGSVLFFLLLAASRTRGSGWNLVFAALIMALWAAAQSLFASRVSGSVGFVVVLDAARYSAWLVVLAHGANTRGALSLIARLGQATCVAVIFVGLLALVPGASMTGQVAAALSLLMPLLGTLAIVLRYVGSEHGQREGTAFLGLGFGLMMVCDAALYVAFLVPGGASSDAWSLRGGAAVSAVLFMVMAVSRGSQWPFSFAVSRDAAFYFSTTAAIGAYLLLCLIGGQLIGRIAGGWGGLAQTLYYTATIALLAVMVASGSLRRWLRVLLTKHFFEHKYDYRDEWLRFIATLSNSEAGEDPRNACARAVAQIIGSPAAVLMTRRDHSRRFEFAAVWPDEEAVPASVTSLANDGRVIDLLGRQDWVIDLTEEIGESMSCPSSLQSRSPGADSRWRLVVPVSFRDDLAGMIFLQQPPGGFLFTFEDRDLLKTAARHIATHLAQYDAEESLVEARKFEAYNRLAAFMLHDLKNVAAQLQLVVANARRHKDHPEFFEDAMVTVTNAAGRITRLIDHLDHSNTRQVDKPADIERVVAMAIENTRDRLPLPILKMEANGVMIGTAREELSNVIEHLVRNAQEATPSSGRIEIVVRRVRDRVVITVADTGRGMTSTFIRDQLFRPFESTKIGKGMGIGAYQAREFAHSLGGEIEVKSNPGSGTTIHLMLPISKLEQAA